MIKKWEDHYKKHHMGKIEIDKDKSIPYYDHKFVEDMLEFAVTMANKAEFLEDQQIARLTHIKEMLK